MRQELDVVAERLFDTWFARLWTAKGMEIEVHAERRRRGLDVEEGLRLSAPFGLGSAQTEWWIPVRRRRLLRGEWTAVRSAQDAERDLARILSAALDS